MLCIFKTRFWCILNGIGLDNIEIVCVIFFKFIPKEEDNVIFHPKIDYWLVIVMYLWYIFIFGMLGQKSEGSF
jgi:hypothetical protein